MDVTDARGSALHDALAAHGLGELFAGGETARVDCPACGASRALKLSLASRRARCLSCGIDAPIETYLQALEEAGLEPEPEYTDAQVIPLRAREPYLPALRRERRAVPASEAEIDAWRAELQDDRGAGPSAATSRHNAADHRRRPLESLIIILLSLVFLAAGLSAAGLSGFANHQAFSASVADPVQGRIWGWAGVIASVSSFGGFTFFWWHVSGGRRKEGLRAAAFALAGAATSVLGTAMFMQIQRDRQVDAASAAAAARPVIEAQIADYRRQLDGIPAETRSVEGLEAYLRGVELAGRTHQKPYRDAQNELGLARRRVALEGKIEAARAKLLGGADGVALQSVSPARRVPAWFFAVMLEVFSSQATSIALVALLVLASGRGRARAAPA